MFVVLRLLVLLSIALVTQSHAWAQTTPGVDAAAGDVEAVFSLLGRRLALMPEVAAAKWHAKLPVFDAAREASVLEETAAKAREFGIEPGSARALISLQMELARAVQELHIARWSPAHPPERAPRDLKGVLRPELDQLGLDLLRALSLALPAMMEPDFSKRLTARAEALLSAQGLPRARAGALLSALSELRPAADARLQRIRASGVLRVGTTFDYAPFSLEQGGQPKGVDIELAQALAQELGVTLRLVRTSWPTLMSDYARDAFDLAASGISVTPERARVATFSVHYYKGGKTPLARCDAKARFGTLMAIDKPEVRVVVNPGGTNEQFVRSALHAAQIQVFPDNRTIFDELVQKRADVMITDDVEAELQQRQRPALCRTTRALLTKADKAWLVQADPSLRRFVDAWLARRVKSGAVARALESALRSASVEATRATPVAPAAPVAAAATVALPPLSLRALAPNVYLHRSHKDVTGFGVVGANGLLVTAKQEALLIDTAYSPEDTALLYQRAQDELHATVRALVVTHAHDDRVAGIDVLRQHQVPSYGLALTQQRAREGKKPVPQHGLPAESAQTLAHVRVETFFPGHGHAPDNLVVYLPDLGVLFGGCMVRAATDGLGFLGDADVSSWRSAIQRVIERFPAARLVVPGHGEPGGRELLTHTRELLDAKLQAKPDASR